MSVPSQAPLVLASIGAPDRAPHRQRDFGPYGSEGAKWSRKNARATKLQDAGRCVVLVCTAIVARRDVHARHELVLFAPSAQERQDRAVEPIGFQQMASCRLDVQIGTDYDASLQRSDVRMRRPLGG
jgi:hypothetical protein